MEKSPDAFRTISEVADWLGVPTHVLRFWESRFPQVKPVKRAGGRRYYRPADMLLLGGIKRLLHDDGMTIRGVQKMLREEGVRHVSSFSQPLDAMAPFRDVTPGQQEEEEIAPSPMAVDVEPEPLDNVVPLAAPAPAEERLILGARAQSGEPEAVEMPAPAQEEEPAAASSPDEHEAPAAPPVAHAVAEPDEREAEDGEFPAADAGAPAQPAAEAEVEPEDEKLPEFSFLRRAAPEPAPTSDPAPMSDPAPEAPQPDLFSSGRAAEPAPAPPRPRIPATPDVPAADAPDDDAATPAYPGLAARLIVHGVRPDHAAIARAVADLRVVRARL